MADTNALADALARAEKAEKALREIAAGSPPNDWETCDNLGDYVGYGKYGDEDYVDDVDPSNNGDVHTHGFEVGLWAAAKIARAGLGIE